MERTIEKMATQLIRGAAGFELGLCASVATDVFARAKCAFPFDPMTLVVSVELTAVIRRKIRIFIHFGFV